MTKIATAEQQSGGRALSTDLLQDRGMPCVAVEGSGQRGTLPVTVDGQDDETDD